MSVSKKWSRSLFIWKSLNFTSYLQGFFTGCRIWGWQFFPSSILKMFPHCLRLYSFLTRSLIFLIFLPEAWSMRKHFFHLLPCISLSQEVCGEEPLIRYDSSIYLWLIYLYYTLICDSYICVYSHDSPNLTLEIYYRF